MIAVKGNKEYTIDESQQKHYQDAGFDIIDDGEVIAYGRGKTVPYDDHMKAVQEIERLRGMITELMAELAQKEHVQEEKKAAKKAGE